MNDVYMVCTESGRVVKGVFREKREAMHFARRCACPEIGFRAVKKRLSEVLLVFEYHDDGSDTLLERL